MGILFIVSTPIGNLEDITLRAIKILEEVDLIACEDTRKTGLLLKKLNIKRKAKLISFYEENEIQRLSQILAVLKTGKNVALVSNAGTPIISDPGFKLVKECLRQKIRVEAIPGPSAVLTALVSSGLPPDKFLFLGFLPKKTKRRIDLLKKLKKMPFPCTLIIFESPLRVIKLLKELKDVFGNFRIVIANELTKMFEKIIEGEIDDLIKKLTVSPLRGEITVLFRIPPK